MSEKRKRRCFFKKYVNGKWETMSGLFHQWGLDMMEFTDAAAVNWTVAIVEDNEGNVHNVHPEHLTFK